MKYGTFYNTGSAKGCLSGNREWYRYLPTEWDRIRLGRCVTFLEKSLLSCFEKCVEALPETEKDLGGNLEQDSPQVENLSHCAPLPPESRTGRYLTI